MRAKWILWAAAAAVAGCAGAAAPFIGTWTRSGTYTVTCPDGGVSTSALTGDLVIVEGVNDDALVATQPDGCQTDYTVSGLVATATPGDTCTLPNTGYIQTNNTHTLTLTSAGASTLTEASTGTLNQNGPICTETGSGTFTKQ
jgi:hypothetical protein